MLDSDQTAPRGFASDNYSGVHPEVLAKLAAANDGHQPSYGQDIHTEHLGELIRQHFGPSARAFPVLTGTGANVIALQAMTTRWGAVVCSESAHVHVDEGGAPEHVGGLKLWTVPTPDGKLTPDLVDRQARGFGDEHRAQPQVVSLTQSTELGTVYSVGELQALCEQAHRHRMRVHLDGARLANAAAALDVPLAALTSEVGVDVVTFGGTKNGLLLGECVVVLDPDLAEPVLRLRKTSMQLASKMRFLSAQFEALLTDDLWFRSARHANDMARRLSESVRDLPGLRITQPVQANAVFAVLAAEVTVRLQQRFAFYVWDESTGEVRWMTTFDTTETDVDAFAAAISAELATSP